MNILCFPRRSADSELAALVGLPVEFAVDDVNVWLRWSDNAAATALQTLPGQRWRLIDDCLLVRPGHVIAEARLPDLSWSMLGHNIAWQWPIPAWPAGQDSLQLPTLTLQRGGQPREIRAGIFERSELARWVDTALGVRLKPLVYAAAQQDCLVIGDPLPPIAYTALWCESRVLIAAGWIWHPMLPVNDVATVFGVADDEWLVWTEPTRWSIVSETSLMPLTRSSMRELMR